MRPSSVAEQWIEAINRHDVEGVAACFAPEYKDESPARPGESVRGRDEVRKNFERLFSSVEDIRAELLGAVDHDDTVWMEWRMRGRRADGTPMEFVGVNIFSVEGAAFRRGRIYTELVQEAGGIEGQLDRMTGRPAKP